MSAPAKDIYEYLAALPEQDREVLQQLRQTIKAAAPEATESIGYRIPAFKYHGPLVSFAAFPDHLSFILQSPPLAEKYRDEVKPFTLSGTTIRFTADNPLPPALVTKLVKARMAENEARVNAKAKK